MRNIYLFCLFICLSASSQSYDKHWKKIADLEQAGKVKSADKIVDNIYRKAASRGDGGQLIKAFLFQSKYLVVLEHDAPQRIIKNLDLEIGRAPAAEKAILNWIMASILTDYYNARRWTIFNRPVHGGPISEVELWSEQDFEKEILKRQQQSLLNKHELANTPSHRYSMILEYDDQEFLNESLFEFLAEQNIRLYLASLHGPKLYPIDKKRFFGSTEEFRTIRTSHIQNVQLSRIIQLYQELEVINSSKYRYERLGFVNSHVATDPMLLINQLDQLQNPVKDLHLKQKVMYLKGRTYLEAASEVKHPEYKVRAMSIFDSIIATKLKSNAYNSAHHQKQLMEMKSIQITTERELYDLQNSRAVISFLNVDSVTISYHRISHAQTELSKTNYHGFDSIANNILKKAPEFSAAYKLQPQHRYFSNSVEILLPKLPIGKYLMAINAGDDVKYSPKYEVITVSDFHFLHATKNQEEVIEVLDKKTGKPIRDVKVLTVEAEYLTDKNGRVRLPYERDKTFIKNSDTITYSSTRHYEHRNWWANISRIQFYLDRSIYRPGQKVFYKGIAFHEKDDYAEVNNGKEVKISVKDAAGKEIKAFTATTNEFGSFSGDFILPSTGVTGNFSISAFSPQNDDDAKKKEVSHGRADFRVEEYKRPKFELAFLPVKENYKIGDKVKVTGKATSFSGSNVSGATVKYEIERYCNFNNGYSEECDDTIANGETITALDGTFTIEFEAAVSADVDAADLNQVTYSIEAQVTDISGETHEENTRVNVGNTALQIHANVPYFIDLDNRDELVISTTTFNNHPIPAKGTVQVWQRTQTDKKIIRRVLPTSRNSLPQDVLEKLFPYELQDSYGGRDPDSEVLVHTEGFDTAVKNNISTGFFKNLKAGEYRIVFSANDSQRKPVSITKYTTLVTANSKLISIKNLNTDTAKDGYVHLRITSFLPEVHLSTTAHFAGYLEKNIIFDDVISLNNHVATIKIPLPAAAKESVTLKFEGVFEKQYFEYNHTVGLSEKEEELSIETETFRSKLEPGSPEKWSFRIKSNKATGQEREVLASMYDGSLDYFKPNQWSMLNSRHQIHLSNKVSSYTGTSTLSGWELGLSMPRPVNEELRLNWFGFDISKKGTFQPSRFERTPKKTKSKSATSISGIVVDATGPIPGVNVVVRGTQRGTQTDIDGYYEIEAVPGEVLVFSYVGMTDFTATIGLAKVINARLTEGQTQLSEVVVAGALGIKRRVDQQTSSTTVVEPAEITQAGAPNVTNGLVGKVAGISINGSRSISGNNNSLIIIDGKISDSQTLNAIAPENIMDVQVLKGTEGLAQFGESGKNGVVIVTTMSAGANLSTVKARENLRETAFFYPELRTDKTGRIQFSFDSPEALTSWKLQLLAHNKRAVSTVFQKVAVTAKELMVVPNLPRFFREKDTIVIKCKVSNAGSKPKIGVASLQLFDARTMLPVEDKVIGKAAVKTVNLPAYGNRNISWKIVVPEGIEDLQYRVVAKCDNSSDGEESIVPVLTNRTLVTESVPVWVRENTTREYTLPNLKNNTSATVKNHQVVFEYTSNPTWLALQALPYLMDYQHSCAEQEYSRLFANMIAYEITTKSPKIAEVFESWSRDSIKKVKDEMLLTATEESPWRADRFNEVEIKRGLAQKFDKEKLQKEIEKGLKKLAGKQLPSGGFPWFEGGTENEFITQHILAGIGSILTVSEETEHEQTLLEMAEAAIRYIEKKNNVQQLLYKSDPYSLHYLYARSFFLKKYPISAGDKDKYDNGLSKLAKDWLKFPLYNKGLASLVLHRFGKTSEAKKILESLRETSATNDEYGMHWVENTSSWYWYQAPIETQALLIEAFAEITNDKKLVDQMKVWLIKNKQNNRWSTTKSTSAAVYALTMQGTDFTSLKDRTTIRTSDKKLEPAKLAQADKEAGSGYVRLVWKADEVQKSLADFSVENKSTTPGYGGIFWQYFEELDRIPDAEGKLNIKKELYHASSQKDKAAIPILPNEKLKIGDKVTIRLTISASEDVEYIHLKDMRASCFEPLDVMSGYRWRDGASYYMSTKDVATHMFFDRIRRGTYIIEYDVVVNNEGNFSNGIATIQSMYAPEFSSHTAGKRINVQ